MTTGLQDSPRNQCNLQITFVFGPEKTMRIAELFLAICTGSSRGCWSLCVYASLFGSLFQVDSMELEHYM